MKKILNATVLILSFTFPLKTQGQQQAMDRDFSPEIKSPLYKSGSGPLMLIDAGHNNFHTLEDKFAPFGKIATQDGFRVKSITEAINQKLLKEAKILVIANALNEKNATRWSKPVYPAFSEEEVKEIGDWVRSGGRLFLIADHMPFPGAVATLAESFGFTMFDGFAYNRPQARFDLFTRANGMLQRSEITDLHDVIDSIVSFTGQAFRIPNDAVSVITLDSTYKLLMPEVAWEFSKDMKMLPAGGMSQLAYRHFGAGKIVVAGEAAMFTAQKAGDVRIGLNAPFARQNLELLLNILEWLDK